VADPILLGILKSVNPRLDLGYVERLRALYKGGRALLQNDAVMRRVFPRHPLESESSYMERRGRAFYDCDLAMVVNKMLAGLAQDPIHFDDGGAGDGRADAPPIPEYWAELQADARPLGDSGPRKTMSEVICQPVLEGMVCGFGWMLCDLPRAPVTEDGAPVAQNQADVESMGLTKAYMVPYRADQVVDWMEEAGTLLWVKAYDAKSAARKPSDDRGAWTVHTWRIWDDQEIATYELELDRNGKDRGGTEWKDDMPLAPTDVVPHTFGAVPWVCFDADAPDEPSLWLGDALESRVRSLFNLANADDHLRRQGSFPQLYEFLGAEDGGPDQVIAENQQNPNRASRRLTLRAPDMIQLRGPDDKALFVSPSMEGSSANRQALQDGKDQIPRIVGVLAYVNDASGAMLRRSGDSKAQDKVSEQVMTLSVGRRALAFANACRDMLARGRGEDPDELPRLKGYENLSTEDAETRMNEHVALSTAPFSSATAKVEHELLTIKTVLGDAATPELLAKMREELEGSITQDQVDAAKLSGMEGADQDVSWDDKAPAGGE
jgi:hypothetical protein